MKNYRFFIKQFKFLIFPKMAVLREKPQPRIQFRVVV